FDGLCWINGKEVVNFASTNYLEFVGHDKLLKHVRLRWKNMVLDLVVLVDSMAQLVVCLVIGDNLKTMKTIALECGILSSDVDTSEPSLIERKVLSSLSDSQREKSC
ncbi:hypothetical protein Gotur_019692, partial [Gossypium turneri]